MATTAAPLSAGTRYRPISGRPPLVWAILDALVLARRSVLETVRIPELIMFVAIQPVMFVILFRYVFGGAIQVPGGQYVNYLMPGIFVQTVAFGGVTTAIGLAQDMQRGIIDRFRSLPMSSSAVLTGRTIADLARNLFTVIIMLIVGFLVGFRPGGTPFEFLLGIVVLLGVDLRVQRLRAGGHHAELVAGLRATQPGVGPRRFPPWPLPREPGVDHRRHPLGSDSVGRLDRRHPSGLRPALGDSLSTHHGALILKHLN